MIDEPTIQRPLNDSLGKEEFIKEVLRDYKICCISREASILGRKDVLTGRGKFGILGDGKEVPQVAMARAFRKGDHRSGYYRDQTFMFALGLCSVENFFAQIYADSENDPFSGGRQMNNHFATAYADESGNWTAQKDLYNISSGISSTGGQMGRAIGLALASKKYRENPKLQTSTQFSDNGNEVVFCTIGDASTSEGVFWETVNAASVMQVPLAISVWDDGFGISVPKKFQTTKEDISEVLEGFRVNEKGEGIAMYKVPGWDYPNLCKMYEEGIAIAREQHRPVLFHVDDLTQPQGHSTSGSHERYKTKERLEWEKEHDCILKMKKWIISMGFATLEELEQMRADAKVYVKECRDRAWDKYVEPNKKLQSDLLSIFSTLENEVSNKALVQEIASEIRKLKEPLMHELMKAARKVLFQLFKEDIPSKVILKDWIDKQNQVAHNRYHTKLYCEDSKAAINIPVTSPVYSADAPMKNGFQILNAFFDKVIARNDGFYAFGEDVGHIGDVNQGFAGLQEKYGIERVFDTGIREWTIVGQALGMAMRGLRPLCEIQYLDYLVYGLPPMTDDLATLRYRTNGLQQAPAIIRTRGHRLEGIWHSGSQMGLLTSTLRGMCVLVPRNMVQAVGMYNTLLQSNDPAVVVEVLNGYRQKEQLPDNIGEYTVPVGVPETLQEGSDVTLVTYGACIRVAQQGMKLLAQVGISVELIDIQSLVPFDLEYRIVESLKKTNRVVFMDEDVPGGASSLMMNQVLEHQGGYQFLDAAPVTITGSEHRPPYGSDGDYFSKPNAEDVFEVIYKLMHESNPAQYPAL